jgi:D-lactate dehydrogenase (cytochrome)
MVLPYTTEHVAGAVRMAAQNAIQVVPRGAGTDLSGEAALMRGGLVISTTRMNKILQLDSANQQALVQPGVVTYDLSQRAMSDGYHFAPDPSSQKTCTIGGNIATNSGGPHRLKYGLTTDHVQAVECVLHDGSILWMGDGTTDAAGYDLTGLVVGSEGSLGVVTRALVRLVRQPEARRTTLAFFPDVAHANHVIAEVVQSGCLPAACEMMDGSAIQAINRYYRLDLPENAGALLLIELDGVIDGLDDLMQHVMTICERHGAIKVLASRSEAEHGQLWLSHTPMFGAIRNMTPVYYLVDSVTPYTWLPSMVEQVRELARQHKIPMGNAFQAGNSELHPMVMCDSSSPEDVRRARQMADELLALSLEQRGVVGGEHSTGLKRQDFTSLLFSTPDVQTMAAIYAVFNPVSRFDATRIFPDDINPLELAAQRQQRMAASQYTLPREQLGSLLERIVGRADVFAGEAAAAYSVQGQRPWLVARPADFEQLSETMAACHQAGASVVPWGGGTQQQIGGVGSAPEVVVATDRLNQVVKYMPHKLAIEVAAGATLADVQALLAQHNQILPLDAPAPERATLGGLVATAWSGPRRLGYGTLRELLLGITFVEVDGTIVRNGLQVVKNIRGYDLVKLMHGSYGTLGVIASVTLKVLPRPQSEATALLHFEAREQALAVLKDLSASRLMPTAVEYLDRGALQHMDMMGEGCLLAIRVEGNEAACARHIRELGSMAARHNCREAQHIRGNDHDALWKCIHAFAATEHLRDDEALLYLAVPPASLGAALAHLEERAPACGQTYAIDAHAMHGAMYIRVCGDADGLRTLQHELTQRWQHSRVLACHPSRKHGMSVWGAQPAAFGLMQAIKQAFDPAHRLNPGRYIV